MVRNRSPHPQSSLVGVRLWFKLEVARYPEFACYRLDFPLVTQPSAHAVPPWLGGELRWDRRKGRSNPSSPHRISDPETGGGIWAQELPETRCRKNGGKGEWCSSFGLHWTSDSETRSLLSGHKGTQKHNALSPHTTTRYELTVHMFNPSSLSRHASDRTNLPRTQPRGIKTLVLYNYLK